MTPSTEKIGLYTRFALIIAIGAVGLAFSAKAAQASRQALYSDGQGGSYCDDSCTGGGCCPDRFLPVSDGS